MMSVGKHFQTMQISYSSSVICALNRLAFINDFCLNQFLLWWLPNNDFLTLILSSYLLVGTWLSTLIRSSSFSPIFYLLLWTPWLQDFFQWFIIDFTFLNWCSNCPIFGQYVLLQALLFIHSFIHSCSLLSCVTVYSRLILSLLCLRCGISSHFSKECYLLFSEEW